MAAVILTACGGGGSDLPAQADGAPIYASCGNLPNYASELWSYRMLRWRQFPLAVHVDLSAAPGAEVPATRQVYLRAIQPGAAKWNVGNGIGTVGFVDTPNADIIIRFSNSVGANTRLGVTEWNGPRPYILSGTTINLNARVSRRCSSTTAARTPASRAKCAS